MQGGGLHAFPGGLEEYEKREGEKAARNDAMLDARVRQEKKARDAAAEMKKQAMSSKGGRNDGQLKQAKQKLDKISRVGLYREDGKAFKLNSLSKMDEKAMRLPSRVSAQRGGNTPDPRRYEKKTEMVRGVARLGVRGEQSTSVEAEAGLVPPQQLPTISTFYPRPFTPSPPVPPPRVSPVRDKTDKNLTICDR